MDGGPAQRLVARSAGLVLVFEGPSESLAGCPTGQLSLVSLESARSLASPPCPVLAGTSWPGGAAYSSQPRARSEPRDGPTDLGAMEGRSRNGRAWSVSLSGPIHFLRVLLARRAAGRPAQVPLRLPLARIEPRPKAGRHVHRDHETHSGGSAMHGHPSSRRSIDTSGFGGPRPPQGVVPS